MIRFENLNRSPMTAHSPKWQEDVIAKVNEEYQEKALEAEREFLEIYNKDLTKVQPGYLAVYLASCMEKVHCFYCEKGIDAAGNKYEAKINVLMHTVAFYPVEEE